MYCLPPSVCLQCCSFNGPPPIKSLWLCICFSFSSVSLSVSLSLTLLPSSSMASHSSLQLANLIYVTKSSGSESKTKTKCEAPNLSKLKEMRLGKSLLNKNNISFGYLFVRSASSHYVSSRALSSMAFFEQIDSQHETAVVEANSGHDEMQFDRINCLEWALHEAAESFSFAVKSLGLAGSGAEVAMAWNGKDVHEWHKRIAYQVAIGALLRTTIEVEILLSHDRLDKQSPVIEILTPRINILEDYIESQLSRKHSDLVRWFRIVELPRIGGYFTPLLKKWSADYAGSGIAGIVVAISCCAAIGKLGSGRVSCPSCTLPWEELLVELMDLSYSLVSMEKLHQLAIEAGFELNFLSHFGAKVLPCDTADEIEFWIGLSLRKLSAAFEKEFDVEVMREYPQKVEADSVATIGLFAYLGKKTRLYLSTMGIKDLDEPIKDFLSYLECGCIFIYPQFAHVSSYQCFIELVIDEIGWLDFYPAHSCPSNQERKRSKQHTIQAEKEMILSTVFTVCYDVFSGLAHFSRSSQHVIDAESLAFLLRSQSLLTTCMDHYLAAYDCRFCELLNTAEAGTVDQWLSVETKGTEKLLVALEAQQRPKKLVLQGCLKAKSQQSNELQRTNGSGGTEAANFTDISSNTTKLKSAHDGLVKKCSVKVVSISTDVWMGTQLLVVDIMDAMKLLLAQFHGQKISRRQRRKLKKVLNDIAALIPVTILMILPLSAVGHAAIIAAIKRYAPFLIPSPYSCERLDIVKQLKRTQKMEVWYRSSLEDLPSKSNLEEPPSRLP